MDTAEAIGAALDDGACPAPSPVPDAADARAPANDTAPPRARDPSATPTTVSDAEMDGDRNWLQQVMMSLLLVPLLGTMAGLAQRVMGPAYSSMTRTTLGRCIREAFIANIGSVRPCAGVQLELGEPIDSNYPFQLHSMLDLPWSVTTGGLLRSTDCSHYTIGEGDACLKCDSVQNDARLLDIILRAADEQLHLQHGKDIYLTHAQMTRRRAHHRARAHITQLRLLNCDGRIRRLLQKTTDANRMVRLLAENKLPRLKALMSQMVKRGHSLHYIIKTLEEAIAGRYHPKGFDKEDEQESRLIKILGGSRLLFAMNKCKGTMSTRTVLERPHPRLVTSASTVTRADVSTGQFLTSF